MKFLIVLFSLGAAVADVSHLRGYSYPQPQTAFTQFFPQPQYLPPQRSPVETAFQLPSPPSELPPVAPPKPLPEPSPPLPGLLRYQVPGPQTQTALMPFNPQNGYFYNHPTVFRPQPQYLPPPTAVAHILPPQPLPNPVPPQPFAIPTPEPAHMFNPRNGYIYKNPAHMNQQILTKPQYPTIQQPGGFQQRPATPSEFLPVPPPQPLVDPTPPQPSLVQFVIPTQAPEPAHTFNPQDGYTYKKPGFHFVF